MEYNNISIFFLVAKKPKATSLIPRYTNKTNDPNKRRCREVNYFCPDAYHPGRGVYRSAAMNAKRLAVTEVNMAYRLSDYHRWQGLDFVQGYEVHRSQNHKPCAVCDAMKGKYPKDFIFAGWHPFCICYATTLEMERSDFVNYLNNGTLPKSNIELPSTATDMIEKLTKGGGSSPLFVEMNKEFLGGKRVGKARRLRGDKRDGYIDV